jgi:hypothetical protein
MHPKVAAGLTVDVPVGEAMDMNPAMTPRSGVEIVRDFNQAQHTAQSNPRDASVHFTAMENDENEIVIQTEDGRTMYDVDVALPEAYISQIKAGYRCINCYEHCGMHLPIECPVCQFKARENQGMRALHEFDEERSVHLGPRKPLREIVEERALRAEMSDFRQRLADGASIMRGVRHA